VRLSLCPRLMLPALVCAGCAAGSVTGPSGDATVLLPAGSIAYSSASTISPDAYVFIGQGSAYVLEMACELPTRPNADSLHVCGSEHRFHMNTNYSIAYIDAGRDDSRSHDDLFFIRGQRVRRKTTVCDFHAICRTVAAFRFVNTDGDIQ
jgi:hypothetical protein